MRKALFILFYTVSTLYGILFIVLLGIDAYRGSFEAQENPFQVIFCASSLSLLIGILLSRIFRIVSLLTFSGLLLFSISYSLWESRSLREGSVDALGVALIVAVYVLSVGSIISGLFAIRAKSPDKPPS
jgi:hypothetical protein